MMERWTITLIMESIDGKLVLDLSQLSRNNDYIILINDEPITTDFKERYVFTFSYPSTHKITVIKKPLKTSTQVIIETLDSLFNSYITQFNKIIENAVVYYLNFQVICNNNLSEIIFKDYGNKIEIEFSSVTVVGKKEQIEYHLKDIKIMCLVYLLLFYIPLILFSLFLIVQSFFMLLHQTVLNGIGLFLASCIILLFLYFFERKIAVLTKCINILKCNERKTVKQSKDK